MEREIKRDGEGECKGRVGERGDETQHICEMKGQTGGEKMQKNQGKREKGEHTKILKEERGGEGVINRGGGKREKRVMRRRR